MSRRSSDGGERRVPDCLSVVRGKQFSRVAVPAFGRKCVFGTAPGEQSGKSPSERVTAYHVVAGVTLTLSKFLPCEFASGPSESGRWSPSASPHHG